MSELASRRDFLIVSAGSALAAGCGGGDQGGGGGDPTNEPIGDPSYYPNSPRQSTPPMDTVMPTCPSTSGLVAGPDAMQLQVDQAIAVAGGPAGTRYFVCRDSGGLFGLNVICPHAGCSPVLMYPSSTWICPCHGSQFAIDGKLINGPAPVGLKKLAVCKGADGKLYIDPNQLI